MKNLLILLSFIPQLLLAEQLNYFCEETTAGTINFNGGDINLRPNPGNQEKNKWSLFLDTKKNFMRLKWLNYQKNEFIKHCYEVEKLIKLNNSLLTCGPEKTDEYSQGKLTVFDIKSLYFADMNPVMFGDFPEQSYIRTLVGKCYKAD